MIEKYGVEFQALTEKFKAKMKELANDIRNFGEKAEEEATVMPKFVDTGYQKQIDYVKSQMEDIQDLLDRADAGEEIGKDTLKLEAEYETLSYKLEDLIEKQKEFNGELEETNETSSSINLGNMFDKSISKIKRFTYYLLGARSVFSLFMKYQSIYYQYNEQMQYQSELSQNAIALSLAPAFEFLGNMVAYASIAFAKFIELLTGVNVLSKVSTKGIRDYNKSLKETQTLISGIDEITNLTNPQNLGLASQYQALADFQKKIAEVEEFFAKNEWIQNIADGLEIVWDWLEKNIFPIVEKIWDFVGKIFKLIETIFDKLGLFDYVVKPIWSLLKVIFHTAEFIVDAITDLFNLDFDKLERDFEKYVDNIKDDFGLNKLNKIKIKVDESNYNEVYKKLQELSKNGNFELDLEFKNEDDAKKFKQWIQDTKEDAEDLGETLDFEATIENDGTIIETFKQKTIDAVKEIKVAIDDTFKERAFKISMKYNIDKNSVLSLASKVKGISQMMGVPASVIDNMYNKILKNFGYAKGLDYVPYDNYPALLHKGETVVPAKYNPTIHSVGNDYTNSLLETLIVKVDNLGSRPNEFNVDGKQLARTMYPLLQSEGRNYTYNEGVVRNG